jgi:hypothetical protein
MELSRPRCKQMRYYYHQDGNVEGPVDLSELEQYVLSGYLPKNVSCCPEGSDDWSDWETVKRMTSVVTPPPIPSPASQPPPIPKDANFPPVLGTSPRLKEYKVLSQKDKWFSQKFDPEMLTQALNSYAQQGWRVIAASTATFPGILGANREEIIVILEREI